MSQPFARRLFDLLRGASREQSLDRLRHAGHRQVSVLSYRDVERMLSEAVDEALADLGLDINARGAAGLTEEARTRFFALLQERNTLRDTVDELKRRQDELSRHRDMLATEVVRTEEELAESHERARRGLWAPADAASAAQRFTSRLESLLGEIEPGLRQRIAAAGGEALGAELSQHLQREQDSREEQLRRRIEKLRGKLQESEALLARVRAAQSAQSAGGQFGSGLPMTPSDLTGPAGAQRAALLDEIFRMNVELQTMMSDLPPSETGP
ncbi:MAG: hypothetical protein ACT4PU_13085 [Planctomycetota bacterium]